MVVLRESRLGRFDFERALDQRAAMALYAAMRGATSPDNGLARRVFDLHRALMGL